MADQNDSKQKQTLNHVNQDDPGAASDRNTAGTAAGNIGGNPGSQHNDWGHSQAAVAGNEQSGQGSIHQPDQQLGQQSGQQAGQQIGAPVQGGGNIGGVPGSQHNDWGHNPVATDGNAQSASASPRQGVMPGEEMGHLQRGQDGKREG